MPEPTKVPEYVEEAVRTACGMAAEAEKPINASGIDPDSWRDQALTAILRFAAEVRAEAVRETVDAAMKRLRDAVAATRNDPPLDKDAGERLATADDLDHEMQQAVVDGLELAIGVVRSLLPAPVAKEQDKGGGAS